MLTILLIANVCLLITIQGVALSKGHENYMFPLPNCFGTYLKTIKMCGFTGNDSELNAIKFLLKEAPVLETLYIYSNDYVFDSPSAAETLDNLYVQIMDFPRTSKDCEIDLE